VNHRFLDVRVHLPSSIAEHAPEVEALVRKRVQRGRIELSGTTDGRVELPPRLDTALAKAAIEQLRELRDEISPGEDVPFGLLASVPGLFQAGTARGGEEIREAVLHATRQACDALDAMRLREGRALAEDLGGRLEQVRAKLAQVRVIQPTIVDHHRQRLRERIQTLLEDRSVPLDEARLEHEVALFAERTDVAEELTRLTSHCDQFDELMQGTGPTHGRKLDFLLQEMAREVNTLGSKTPEVEVTRIVVEMKADVERLREQVQNVL
jgi:uncharacterized protein (TIGR00255 family)